jgi:hypothetical protein
MAWRHSPQAMAARRNMPPSNVPIEGLALGPLIGKGSFGRVYRARWHDRPVAVKVSLEHLGLHMLHQAARCSAAL